MRVLAYASGCNTARLYDAHFVPINDDRHTLCICNASMNTKSRRWLTATFAVLSLVPLNTTAQQVPDSTLKRSLEQAFERDFRLRDADIEVSTSLGTATLKGTVDSYSDRQTAGEIAKRTAGVKSVVNNIKVELGLRRDNEIADDVRRRLTQSSFIRATDLDVQVASGVVTLAGTVPTYSQSQQAAGVAREVRGVRTVRNNVIVSETFGVARRSSEAIQADVEAELARDGHLADLPIRVTVDEGVVRLQGEVPNLFHRERAAEESRRIAGVRSVENELSVMSQLLLDLSPEPPSDAELRRVVLEELQADPRVAATNIDAAVSRGRVTLIGVAASMFERQASERIARSVTGVSRVENQLEVAAIERDDDEIRADVQFNLNSDSMLKGETLTVTVRNGSVTLAGEVKGHAAKFHAARLVARVRGVRSITNDVRVAWDPTTDDDTVRVKIEERLKSNGITQANATRIRVTVKEGHVTLSGSVNRSSEVNEAARIARLTDGARNVTNDLTLRR